MFATLKRDWEMIDGETGKPIIVFEGRYEIERIDNPFGHDAPWLVLKGTKIGQAEGSWRQWKNGEILDNLDHLNHDVPVDWKKYEIIIEE